MSDFMEVEILEDGTLSITTGSISGTNHISADELLLDLENELGGTRTTKKRENHHHHHQLRKNNKLYTGS